MTVLFVSVKVNFFQQCWTLTRSQYQLTKADPSTFIVRLGPFMFHWDRS